MYQRQFFRNTDRFMNFNYSIIIYLVFQTGKCFRVLSQTKHKHTPGGVQRLRAIRRLSVWARALHRCPKCVWIYYAEKWCWSFKNYIVRKITWWVINFITFEFFPQLLLGAKLNYSWLSSFAANFIFYFIGSRL